MKSIKKYLNYDSYLMFRSPIRIPKNFKMEVFEILVILSIYGMGDSRRVLTQGILDLT
jgi:hypothetical protein